MSGCDNLQLRKKVFIEGEIELLTGLHIGGSSLGLSIGGADKVVVRNPITNLPYIPGSSLKGKMRSLLERAYGLVEIRLKKSKDGKDEWSGPLCTNPEEDVVQLFGSPGDTQGAAASTYGPTRLTVRDADLGNEGKLAAAENTDMYCTEIKTEVSIDRLTAVANPRNFERVPAGAKFQLSLVVDLYNIDFSNEAEDSRADRFIQLLSEGLSMVQDDYLGGQGTRGYGQVRFNINSVTERTVEAYRTRKMEKQKSDYQSVFEPFLAQGDL
ncbi:MAG: type III-A CRISPR-associated RAMP protein Csm3 [Desulfosarcina sp.]|nr:type III-A CRISPR-associated RAMP protein Csm3 [Desulfosarcina sp.]MBC2744361.1 type III-A CRISPR-associated RAMP protein Csm3 [Desulfosarcina sp.]MBC2767270.1 type III-A CRISPR-associated RAMP protein Csm3 [Desulfosarcina sp.]